MDNRTLAIAIIAMLMLGFVMSFMIYGTLRARLALQDANITKYQEKTKRAEERHELIDVFRHKSLDNIGVRP